MTLDAGVQWYEAYGAVNNYGRLMVGGSDRSIGSSGGWLAGGGHSILSPNYGLGKTSKDGRLVHEINRQPEGVDNAIEISVVLSTGEFLITNEYQNSDLFWALRGGGGSTYGIVTSVTYHTYLSVPAQFYAFQVNITNSSVLPELVGELLRFQTQFTDDGWGGYGSITEQQLSFLYAAPNMTNETAMATTEAWHNYTLSLEPFGAVTAEQRYWVPAWYELLQNLLNIEVKNGQNILFTSRLLSRDTLANKYTEMAEILVNCSGSVKCVLHASS